MTRGRFITFEGIDGAGKSSHLDHVCDLVRAAGHRVDKTLEPGGTRFGVGLREVILARPTSALAEALAVFAARAAHVEERILPALDAGTWVVCDRFTDSTYAYQCGGNGLDPAAVRTLERLVHPHLQPDLTLLFDLDPAVAAGRQQAQGRAPDAFESRSGEYFTRVRDAYLERARESGSRIRLIDASLPLESVRAAVGRAFRSAFP